MIVQAQRLVHALVISKLDMNNGLLYGLPDSVTAPLQRVQNSAARLVCGVKKRDHITRYCENFTGSLLRAGLLLRSSSCASRPDVVPLQHTCLAASRTNPECVLPGRPARSFSLFPEQNLGMVTEASRLLALNSGTNSPPPSDRSLILMNSSLP